VTWRRGRVGNMEILSVGSSEQRALRPGRRQSSRRLGILPPCRAADSQAMTSTAADSQPNFSDGRHPVRRRSRSARQANRAPLLAVAEKLQVSNFADLRAACRSRVQQPLAIEYMNRRLRPYWARNGKTVQAMLIEAMQGYAFGGIEVRCIRPNSSQRSSRKMAG